VRAELSGQSEEGVFMENVKGIPIAIWRRMG